MVVVTRAKGRYARWLGRGLVGAGLAMLPWLVVLWSQLPDTITVSHWAVSWVGLDGAEALGLLTTGLLYLRRDPRAALTAAVTATLLLVDAWFDVSTSAPGAALATSIGMAVLAEIPIAILCAVLALRLSAPVND